MNRTIVALTPAAEKTFDRTSEADRARPGEAFAIPSRTMPPDAKAGDARKTGSDDDLGPWVAMPDGGLEWRGM